MDAGSSPGGYNISQSDIISVSLHFLKSEELHSQAVANEFLEENGFFLQSRCPDDAAEIIPYKLWQELRLQHAVWDEFMAHTSKYSAGLNLS